MRTRSFLIVLIVFSLLAAACSSSASTSSTSSNTSGAGSQNQAANASLSPAARLALGTLKLEGTDQAVTADQAATLITLWQAYQALSNSDTTAQVELDAVIKQIQGAMTSEQVKALDAMTLTRQSTNEVLQSLGMAPNVPSGAQGTPAAGQSATSGNSTTRGNGFPAGGPGTDGGGPGGGGFPAGGAPGGDMGGVPPDAAAGTTGIQATPNATAQARMNTQTARVSPMLLQALIQILQSKVQG